MFRFRFLSPAALCAGLAWLAACQHDPAARQDAPHTPRDPYATTLRVDRRYRDSTYLGPPYSQAILRQMAIEQQLIRLRNHRKDDSLRVRAGLPDTAQVYMWFDASVRLRPNGRLVLDTAKRRYIFPNRAAELADIRREIDALEALERTVPLPR